MAESRCPPGVGDAGGEGLGRSRGGFTTKLHLSADGRCRPLSLVVTPGQRADCTQFKPVLDKIRVPRLGTGRPRKKPDSLAADMAYSNRPYREYLRCCGIRHTIPEKTDSQAARRRKGSRGGRPPGFDEERYTRRNTVERAINRLKQSRALLATTARLRLPWHRDSGSRGHLASDLMIRGAGRDRSRPVSVAHTTLGVRSCPAPRRRLPEFTRPASVDLFAQPCPHLSSSAVACSQAKR